VTAAFRDAADSNEMYGGDITGPYDEMSRALAELPRPRAVRMSRRGKSTVALIVVVIAVSMGMFFAGLSARSAVMARNGSSPQYAPFVLPIIFLLVIAPLMVRTITRQKILLTDGEIATARVTDQRRARHGATIRYDFTTRLGDHFSRGASDGPGQLSVGMNVPIFYDPQNPSKQLALCGSFYEVVLPGKE
jgi:hypothetical protein